eukprot:6947859-Prymnesium_polylepis.1
MPGRGLASCAKRDETDSSIEQCQEWCKCELTHPSSAYRPWSDAALAVLAVLAAPSPPVRRCGLDILHHAGSLPNCGQIPT